MKKLDIGYKVNLEDVYFDDFFEKIAGCVRDNMASAVEDVITDMFEEGLTYVSFPIVWHKSRKDYEDMDPLTIYISIDANIEEPDSGPTYQTTLREELQDDINACMEDGSHNEGLKRISAALKEFASEIDAVTK